MLRAIVFATCALAASSVLAQNLATVNNRPIPKAREEAWIKQLRSSSCQSGCRCRRRCMVVRRVLDRPCDRPGAGFGAIRSMFRVGGQLAHALLLRRFAGACRASQGRQGRQTSDTHRRGYGAGTLSGTVHRQRTCAFQNSIGISRDKKIIAFDAFVRREAATDVGS